MAKVRGLVTVTTGGNLQMRWAQASLDAGVDTTVYLDSFIKAQRIN